MYRFKWRIFKEIFWLYYYIGNRHANSETRHFKIIECSVKFRILVLLFNVEYVWVSSLNKEYLNTQF